MSSSAYIDGGQQEAATGNRQESQWQTTTGSTAQGTVGGFCIMLRVKNEMKVVVQHQSQGRACCSQESEVFELSTSHLQVL